MSWVPEAVVANLVQAFRQHIMLQRERPMNSWSLSRVVRLRTDLRSRSEIDMISSQHH